jgi:hypothetical protein
MASLASRGAVLSKFSGAQTQRAAPVSAASSVQPTRLRRSVAVRVSNVGQDTFASEVLQVWAVLW